MKPSFPLIDTLRSRDSFGRVQQRFAAPMTDCFFKANGFDGFREGPREEKRPSFRKISDSYFRTEAHQHFVTEAAFFALIVLTVAIPVIEGIRGLARLF